MGKVGSSTIYHAIKRNKPYSSVFHIHFLSDNWLKGILPSLTKHFQKNISLGEEILEEIERNPDKRLKVITLSREPVSLAISDLFENWEQHYTDIESVSNEELKNHIEQVDHEYSLNWFDSEFFNYLGIDLYNLPFDREKGYEIYNFEKLDILCIKLESLNQVSAKAFREFIDIEIGRAHV